MKKKLISLSLALLLALSAIPSGLAARAQEPEPDPIPVVTLQPVDPEKPGEPPAETQGDPDEPPDGKTPPPKPIGLG